MEEKTRLAYTLNEIDNNMPIITDECELQEENKKIFNKED